MEISPLKIKHVLFPVDFSERSYAAAPFVACVARRFGAEVTLLNAVPPLFTTDPTGMALAEMPSMEELRSNAEAHLETFLPAEFGGITVRRLTKVGDPAAVITDFAQAEAVDLIMMPTHGWGPFRSLLLGSVANKVLHDAHCPVWTAAHTEDAQVHPRQHVKNIVCGLDCYEDEGHKGKGSDDVTSNSTTALLTWVAQFARTCDANLHLVHAVSGAGGWPEVQLSRDFEESLREQAHQALEKHKEAAGVIAPLCVGVGDIAAVIAKEAEKHNADIVVIGRGVLDKRLGRLRTHTYSIIRNSPCPVISV